jgi:hypothetical protein
LSHLVIVAIYGITRVANATSDPHLFSCPACVSVDNTSGVLHNV